MAYVSSVPLARQYFYDSNGNPLSGGSVGHYTPGTLTPISTWSDYLGTVLNANPLTLDSGGGCEIYGNGNYRQIVKDSLGNTIYDQVVAMASANPTLATIAALRALTGSISVTQMYVLGYATAADGGQGMFVYVSTDTTTTDNGGTIIVDTANRRWYRDLGGQPASIKHFGATGNGTTDDTAAINRALTAIAPGKLRAPAGTYVVSASMTLNDGQFIEGDGPEATFFKVNHATADIFIINTASSYWGAGLRGFTMLAGVTRTAGRYIYNQGGFSLIEDFDLRGQFIGIESNATGDNIVNGSIRDTVPATGTAIKLSGGGDHYISNIVCDNPSGQPAHGLWIAGTQGGYNVEFCDFIRCGYGVLIDCQTGQTINWGFLTGVQCDTCSANPICIQTAGTGVINGVSMVLCWASSGSGDGIYINGAGTAIDGIEMIGMRCINNATNGMEVAGTVKHLQIDGGYWSGNSISSSGTYIGISLAATVVNTLIRGTRIGPAMSWADSQGTGLGIASGISGLVVEDCDLSTAHTALSFGGAPSGSCRVRNNLGYKTEATGSGEVLSGATTAVITHNLNLTPAQTDIMVTPTTNPNAAGISWYWVSATSATTFTVTVNATTTANWFFGWSCAVGTVMT